MPYVIHPGNAVKHFEPLGSQLTPKEFRHRAQGCERSELPWDTPFSTRFYANGVTSWRAVLITQPRCGRWERCMCGPRVARVASNPGLLDETPLE